MANLYETIEQLCTARGIKPGQMCAALNLSRGMITDLKMGRKKGLSAETAQKIAGYFGITVATLLGQPQPDVLDQIDIAFYGEFKELTEEQKATVRDMVRLMRQRQQEKESV